MPIGDLNDLLSSGDGVVSRGGNRHLAGFENGEHEMKRTFDSTMFLDQSPMITTHTKQIQQVQDTTLPHSVRADARHMLYTQLEAETKDVPWREIDLGILDLVYALHTRGFLMFTSCEGKARDISHQFDVPTVRVWHHNSIPDPLRKDPYHTQAILSWLALLLRYTMSELRYKNFTIRTYWPNLNFDFVEVELNHWVNDPNKPDQRFDRHYQNEVPNAD